MDHVGGRVFEDSNRGAMMRDSRRPETANVLYAARDSRRPETAILERVKQVEDSAHNRIDELHTRLDNVTGAAIAELRRDLADSRDVQTQQAAHLATVQQTLSDFTQSQKPAAVGEASLQILRNDIDRRSAQQREVMTSIQNGADQTRLQVGAAEAALADLRNEFAAERERQEFKADGIKTILSEFRQELNKLQVAQLQALQDHAMQTSSDISRSMHDVSSIVAATQDSLTTRLQTEVEGLRRELDNDRSRQDEMLRSSSDISRSLQDSMSARLQQEVTGLRLELERTQNDGTLQSASDISRTLEDSLSSKLKLEVDGLRKEMEFERIRYDEATRSTSDISRSIQDSITLQDAMTDTLQKELQGLRSQINDDRCKQDDWLRTSAEMTRGFHKELEGFRVQLESSAHNTSTVARADDAASAHLSTDESEFRQATGKSIAELRTSVGANRSEIERLSREMIEERNQRYKALADIARITEEVATAASTTIENAEKRFAEAIERGRKEQADHPDKQLESMSTASSDDNRYASRRVGDIDSELKSELANRVRVLTQEIRHEILGEVSVRVSSAEARVNGIEVRLAGDLQRVTGDLSTRVSRLEVGQRDLRMSTLEEEVRRNNLAVAAFIDERVHDKMKDDRVATDAAGASAPGSAPGDHSPTSAPKGSRMPRLSARTTHGESSENGGSHVAAIGGSHAAPMNFRALGTARASCLKGAANPSSDSLAEGSTEAISLSTGLKASLEGLIGAVNKTLSADVQTDTRATSPPHDRGVHMGIEGALQKLKARESKASQEITKGSDLVTASKRPLVKSFSPPLGGGTRPDRDGLVNATNRRLGTNSMGSPHVPSAPSDCRSAGSAELRGTVDPTSADSLEQPLSPASQPASAFSQLGRPANALISARGGSRSPDGKPASLAGSHAGSVAASSTAGACASKFSPSIRKTSPTPSVSSSMGAESALSSRGAGFSAVLANSSAAQSRGAPLDPRIANRIGMSAASSGSSGLGLRSSLYGSHTASAARPLGVGAQPTRSAAPG